MRFIHCAVKLFFSFFMGLGNQIIGLGNFNLQRVLGILDDLTQSEPCLSEP